MEEERKLASIQKILDIQPIPDADAIEVATIQGWKVVVKKGDFQIGDLAIYFEVDSFLPICETFEFLRKGCYKRLVDGTEGFRLRTIRLRKQLSQGLLMPIEILRHDFGLLSDESTGEFDDFIWNEGDNVTELVNVIKYDPPLPACLAGDTIGRFPSFLIKTDETRIQSIPEKLEELKGKHYYITTKLDGTSATFYNKDGDLGACSRNLEKKYNEDNTFWKMADKYNLKTVLQNGIALQGEIVGPGIQKNPLMLKDIDFYVFNGFNIPEARYFTLAELIVFTKDNGLKMVPIEEVNDEFNYTLDELLERAKGKYEGTERNKEGIVVRSLDKSISFKVLNNDFLLKEE